MTGLPLGQIIELLVAVLLVLTIGYCVVLNARLKRLRSDEEALKATISELVTATEIAERAIYSLKTTAIEADRALGQRLKDAEDATGDLSRLIDASERARRGLQAETSRVPPVVASGTTPSRPGAFASRPAFSGAR